MSLRSVLDAIRADIRDSYFVLCFDMETGQPVGVSTTAFAAESARIGESFRQVISMVRVGQKEGRNDMIRTALHGFRELILETDISTFFVVMPDSTARFAVAVGTPKDVHLEYVRVALDKHAAELAQAIRNLTS